MPDTPGSDPRLADDLARIVGRTNVITESDVKAPFEVDWTRRFEGPSTMVVRPSSTEQVSEILGLLSHRGIPVVVQGGNTGLVGGGVPAVHRGSEPLPVLLSTTRLSAIGEVDPASSQITAGAGVTLGTLQTAAAAAGLTFPVDLAARDTATVGGMIATNAGGLHVLRYGSMRGQVVGVEAVLANGTVISRLSGLVKDNTGYDLSQLLVGSEGTLAVITAARLRLVPRQTEVVVALLGLPDTGRAIAVFEALRRAVEGLQAAEIFYDDGLELVISHTGTSRPLAERHPCYLVVEAAGLTDQSDTLFGVLAESGIAEEATAVSVDDAGSERLWAYRERHTEAVSSLGVPHKLDVTLPQGRLAEFERAVRTVVASSDPAARLVLFGHVGDGNLHVNVVGPSPEDDTVDEAVVRLVASMDGSVSAEHGIGRAKVKWLPLSRSESEIGAMRALKSALDPQSLLNPGVLFAEEPESPGSGVAAADSSRAAWGG